MTVFDIKILRKEVENEYLNKGYSGEKLENALRNDSRYPKDRLIEVTGYDLENNKVLGLLGNKKCEVTISHAAFNKAEKAVASSKIQSPNSWMGHKIDENMAKSIPVKSQLILQESVIETSGSVISLVASRIVKVQLASENTVAGLFSMTSANGTALSQTIEKLRNDTSSNNSIKPKK